MAAIKTKPDSEILEVLQELESHFQENQEFSFTTVRYIYLSLLSNIKKILYEISNNSDEWEKIDDLQLLPITSVDTIPTCIHNLGQAALFINHFIQDKSKNKKIIPSTAFWNILRDITMNPLCPQMISPEVYTSVILICMPY